MCSKRCLYRETRMRALPRARNALQCILGVIIARDIASMLSSTPKVIKGYTGRPRRVRQTPMPVDPAVFQCKGVKLAELIHPAGLDVCVYFSGCNRSVGGPAPSKEPRSSTGTQLALLACVLRCRLNTSRTSKFVSDMKTELWTQDCIA